MSDLSKNVSQSILPKPPVNGKPVGDQRVVAVAMSGGVDSSVAASLLLERGERVIGVMMQLWSDPDYPNRCCSPDDVAMARQVAALLDIPFYAIDAQDVFKHHVVDYFLESYAQGITPNPCIECNRHVRWNFLHQQALSLGATHLATGHYARIDFAEKRFRLLRALDLEKDQSYVLHILDQAMLSRTIFPIGNFSKSQVRDRARMLALPMAEREESQDLCFIGDRDYHRFLLDHHAPLPPPGPIVDTSGNQVGMHRGLAAYTIGQRKGIGVNASYPLYVIQKNVATNALVVGPKEALGRDAFTVDQVHWIDGSGPTDPIQVQVQIRYRSPETDAEVIPLESNQAIVQLSDLLPDITPGQFAVFYHREECLGGGVILS